MKDDRFSWKGGVNVLYKSPLLNPEDPISNTFKLLKVKSGEMCLTILNFK